MAEPIIPEPEIAPVISINGVDWDPSELESIISKGKQTIDLEKQWNTPVDKVWPEYGQTREQLKTISSERDEYKQKLADFEAKQNAGVETPTDVREAQEAARKLGLTLKEDLDKEGYVRKDDLDKYLSEREVQQQEVKKVLEKADSLEKEINGTDGRPAFNKRIVLAYANAYNISDLEKAYEDMHKPQLDAWKAEQVNSQRSKGLKTLGQGGEKSVKETKVTDDNVNSLLSETLYGGE